MKTYLVFDTNALSLGSNATKFGDFSIRPILMDLVNKIEKNTLLDKYKILVPKIVLEELKQQQLESFYAASEELKTLRNRMDKLYFVELNESYVENYREQLEEMMSSFLNDNDIGVLNVCSDSKLNKIVDRALTKKPPFRGEKGKSDKGFKDVLIWESLIEFSERNNGNFIYVTRDGDYLKHDKYLKREFKEITNQNIDFLKPEDLEKTPNLIDDAINDRELIERLNTVKNNFNEIQEELFDELKDNCFQEVHTLGNTFKEVQVIFSEELNFYEINDSLFEVTIPSTVTLDDTGIHYELSVKVKVELVIDYYEIINIKLIETVASLLNGKLLEDFTINPFEKKIIEPMEDIEEIEVPKKVPVNVKATLEGKYYFKEAIKVTELDDIIQSVGVKIFTPTLELIKVIEESTQIDWYTFVNKEAILRTEIKKVLRKNNENVQIIDDLTKRIIEFAKECHKNFEKRR